jgi:hypothetical protein
MNKKKVCKKGSKKANCGFVTAQSCPKAQLKKTGSKKAVSKTSFSDDNSGHCTPDTEHQKREIGPGEALSLGSRV